MGPWKVGSDLLTRLCRSGYPPFEHHTEQRCSSLSSIVSGVQTLGGTRAIVPVTKLIRTERSGNLRTTPTIVNPEAVDP